MDEFVKSLKKYLIQKKDAYVFHNSWCGGTETGFYTTDEIDMDELLKQIDEFSESFKKGGCNEQ